MRVLTLNLDPNSKFQPKPIPYPICPRKRHSPNLKSQSPNLNHPNLHPNPQILNCAAERELIKTIMRLLGILDDQPLDEKVATALGFRVHNLGFGVWVVLGIPAFVINLDDTISCFRGCWLRALYSRFSRAFTTDRWTASSQPKAPTSSILN